MKSASPLILSREPAAAAEEAIVLWRRRRRAYEFINFNELFDLNFMRMKIILSMFRILIINFTEG